MKFEDLGLSAPLVKAVTSEGYTTPTPIQAQAIPHVLAGSDLFGCAQTGTGKTAAFALPMLHLLDDSAPPQKGPRKIRALVLSPTRELAQQIFDSFRTYGRHTALRFAAIFGGVNQNPQARELRNGIDVLVATPGRLLDLMNQGLVDLRAVEMFVLDEADRMLDMGFLPDIRKIVARIPAERQTLLFSATMPDDIRRLAETILNKPVNVQVARVSAAERIEQLVYFVDKRNKPALLTHLLHQAPGTRALVFTRTKHGADRVVRQLTRAGIHAAAIHGDKTQANRERALRNFKLNRTSVLIATDIAARGIDIDDVSHVYNFDVPEVAETYVHRIGRTARAGASGIAVAFCDPEERSYLKAIERLIRQPITAKTDHPVYKPAEALAAGDADVHDRPRRVGPSGAARENQSAAARRARQGGQRNRKPAGPARGPTVASSASSSSAASSSAGENGRARRRKRRRPGYSQKAATV